MAGGQKTFAALPQMKSGQDRVSQNILRHLEKNKLDIGGEKKTRLKDRFLLNYIQYEALFVFFTDFTHLFLSHHGKLLM